MTADAWLVDHTVTKQTLTRRRFSIIQSNLIKVLHPYWVNSGPPALIRLVQVPNNHRPGKTILLFRRLTMEEDEWAQWLLRDELGRF